MGRTGAYFAWQNYGVKPDIVASAKALGCGVPVGAFLVTEKVASSSLEPGDHGSTYGGNPLVSAAVSKVIDIMEEKDIPGHVKALTPHFEARLDELVSSHPSVLSRRGMGFMQGLVIREDVKSVAVVAEALSNGLVTLSAGGNVLRLLPPLVMTKEDIDEGISILDATLKEFD
jgi:acetylornithine/N-succinyldiaminopimelate aminotransferase